MLVNSYMQMQVIEWLLFMQVLKNKKVNKDLRIDFENVIYENKNRNIDVWYSNNKVIVSTI
jgi:hypothetical protein